MLSSVYAPKDFKRLRVSGDLVARCFDYITPHIVAGVSTGEIDRLVAQFLKENGEALGISAKTAKEYFTDWDWENGVDLA